MAAKFVDDAKGGRDSVSGRARREKMEQRHVRSAVGKAFRCLRCFSGELVSNCLYCFVL